MITENRKKMLKETIIANTNTYTLQIPNEYLNRRLEIMVFPTDEIKKRKEKDKKIELIWKTAGILKKENIDPITWQKNLRDEWER